MRSRKKIWNDSDTPVRKCVGCRGRRSKTKLLRFVVKDGAPELDPAQRMPGRGIYVCPGQRCLRRAVKHRAGALRGLRRETGAEVVPGVIASLDAYLSELLVAATADGRARERRQGGRVVDVLVQEPRLAERLVRLSEQLDGLRTEDRVSAANCSELK